MSQANLPENVQLETFIEPPMELSQELPITLSQSNRLAFISNPKLLNDEAAHNASIFISKTFPFLPLFSAFIVGLTILLIRILSSETQQKKIDPLTKEKKEMEIKQKLEKLLSTDAKATDHSIIEIDFLFRSYLENKYGFPAFAYTSQELANKIESLPDISFTEKEEMKKTFKDADIIKFAKEFKEKNL